MKGIVFTEFIEMVEKTFSPELADEMFDAVPLESGGAYTSVGTYDHNELVLLVIELSQRLGVEAPALTYAFGKHLLKYFVAKFPEFFEEVEDTFEFLEQVDSHIHAEVRKLYPDAELPCFHTRRVSEDEMEMVYVSERPFEDLAHGLIEATIEHFGESIEIERRPTDEGVMFLVKHKCEAPTCPN